MSRPPAPLLRGSEHRAGQDQNGAHHGAPRPREKETTGSENQHETPAH